MTRVKRKTFFKLHHINYTEDIEKKYSAGWTLDEIKKGKEYIIEDYNKEVKAFKKSIQF